MLRSSLLLSLKVLLRRKFFTFVSLFAVAFTLLVLLVAAALLDHVLGPHYPETRSDRTLAVLAARLRYVWTLALVFRAGPQSASQLFPPFCANWRPVLALARGAAGRGLPAVSDTYTVGPQRKAYHPWEQPLAPWRHWLPPRCCSPASAAWTSRRSKTAGRGSISRARTCFRTRHSRPAPRSR